MQKTFTFTVAEGGERLDKFLTTRLEEAGVALSRVRVQQLIKDGHATLNGKVVKSSARLEGGETLVITYEDDSDQNAHIVPETIDLDVLYEDAALVAINKPAGMVVHPAVGHTTGTLVNALLARYPQVATVGGENRAGIVHRLDKDTSGVIIVAKTEPARLRLMQQFAARTVQKRYLTLVDGMPDTPAGEINAPIARDPNQRKRMAVVRSGRESVTNYKVLQTFEQKTSQSIIIQHSYIECFPKTGRTHQIRVHMAFIGCPIVGDPVYGRRKPTIKLGRHFLHAESITLTTPDGGKVMTFRAPLPAELQSVLEHLANTQ
jgi:23S rRNA pseudouridine1911/1915/1917 synthase